MGLLGDSLRGLKKMKDPVDGTAQVVGSTQPPENATSGHVKLTLVVQGNGVEATSVEYSCIAPSKKWPFPGQTLPVTVDRADPTLIKVRWDDVPKAGDVAKQQADALAAQMQQGGGVAPGISGAGADVNQIVQALQQSMPGAQINVDGAGAVGDAAPQSDGEDRVAQLERLTKLRDSGALTEQEFEREKARILGS
jgi:hypothetical protein